MDKPIIANLDDIVFDSRNKEYGAYLLRKNYTRNVRNGFIFGTIGLVLLVSIPFIASWIEQLKPVDDDVKRLTYAELTEPPPMDENKPPPPPPTEIPPPPQRAAIKFVIPEPVPDEEAKPEETIVDIDSIKEKNVDTETKEGTDDGFDFGAAEGTGNQAVEEKKEEEPDPNAFILVEKEPQPVNLTEIRKNISYPPQAKEAGITGKVILRILVNKEGEYDKHIVVKSPHKLLTDACVEQVKNLKFTPGIQAGKPIKVWVTIPFDFKLQ